MDRTIDYVLEVAKCGGIAKAAKNLYITPSALSKYIIQKEEELGVGIFNREGYNFTLTYAGERYVELLKEMNDSREKMRLEMSRLADLYSGRLRVGFQMAFAELGAKKILPLLQDEYPSIRIFLEEDRTAELMSMLRKNQLDIILTLVESRDDGLRYDKIADSPVVLAAAKGSPLKNKAVAREGFAHPWLGSEEILRENFIFDKGGRNFRRYVSHLTNMGKKLLHSDIMVTNARTALLCVEQDMGVIVLPEIIVSALGFSKKVELFSCGTEQAFATLFAVSDKRSVLVNEIQRFGDMARESVN